MIIAFDPGVGASKPGGMCIVGDEGVFSAISMPLAGKTVAIQRVLSEVRSRKACKWPPLLKPIVVVERQHARPQDSYASINIMLPAYGQLIGMAAALEWPLVIVQPKDWKAVTLRGTPRDKAAACAFVSQRYPHIDLLPGRKTTAHDGIADAVCIAHWFMTTSK